MRYLLSFLFLFSFSLFAQTYTGVPDDNFEQHLINSGYDDVLDDYVLTSNINSIVWLDVSDMGISNLEGIEDFSSLQYLTCSYNGLEEIDLCSNFNLLFLDCSNNSLNSLNLSHLPLLESLVCEGNDLVELDLSQNSNLNTLNILGNPVQCVQVGNLYTSQYDFLNTNLTIDPNNEDYFSVDCGYFSSQCSGPVFYGWVFYDEDEDGVKDDNEIYLPDQIIRRDNISDFVTVSSNSSVSPGSFGFVLEDGEYAISVVPNDGWITTTQIDLTVQDNVPSLNDVHLGVFTDVPGHNDFAVDLTATNQLCANGVNFFIHYENLGVVNSDIELTLTLDPNHSYSTSSASPVLINGNEIVWNISNVGVDEDGVIEVFCGVSGGAGQNTVASIVLETPDLTGVMSDFNLDNNYDYVQDAILCSYDPNDKLVTPGLGDQNYVEFQDTLEYTLRFQNVGNYFAFNVRIEDTISDFLDMTSFRFIESSHDVYYEFGEERSLVFYFDDIMLIDSLSDPFASQGFVKFAIAPKEDIGEFTVVENTGFIYFDYNEAVVTNTTVSTFVSEITFGCLDSDACNYDGTVLIEDNDSCEFPEFNFDCNGNCIIDVDCSGECGGGAIYDECGVCNGDNTTCLGCTDDTACNYDDTAIIDDDGCEYPISNFDCDGNCIVDIDCNGVCGGDAVVDCAGVCGGSSVEDECGECDGSGPEENYDCDGNCVVDVDCNGECGGGAIYDECGECDGSGPEEYYDCDGNCISDIDLDLVCDELDNCPSHYNPNQEDVDQDGIGDACDVNVSITENIGGENRFKIIDLLGRNTVRNLNSNQISIYIFDNGEVQKNFNLNY